VARPGHHPATSAPQKHSSRAAQLGLDAPGQVAMRLVGGCMTLGGGVRAVNGVSMPPSGLLLAGLWRSRAMNRFVWGPGSPGKRWLVSGVWVAT
jgi:hypothetical protein